MSHVIYQSSFGFRFKETESYLPCILTYVGQDLSTGGYNWEGLKRTDRGGPYLFQYTLSGSGWIRIEQEEYPLHAGTAFFVPFRSDYHYYMPESSDRYECIFISFGGREAVKCWSYLKAHNKQVMTLSEHSQLIRTLRYIFQKASNKQIKDAYKASLLTYQFILELYRYCSGHALPDKRPAIVNQAIELLENKYDRKVRLDDVSAELGVSKYHLIKLFRESTGKTPIQYLNKIRLEKAMELLRSTDMPVEAIGQQTGFIHANYFTKVFKSAVGVPPGQFRSQRFPDHLTLD